MATNQSASRSLGTVSGEVVIDVSSVQQAQVIVERASAAIRDAMLQINQQGGGVSNNGIAQAVQERTQAIEDSSDAWLMADVVAAEADDSFAEAVTQNTATVVSATETRAAADSASVQAAQAAAEARIAAVEGETQAVIGFYEEQAKAATASADAQSNGAFTGTRPTGLARSVFSLGFAAQGLGLSGLAQPAFAVGGLAQVVEEIPLFNNQITEMATRLLSMDGVFGAVARAGGDVALSLGMAGGGLGASLLAIGAVALPVIAVVGLLVAALGQSEAQAKATADALEKEAALKGQVSAGATTTDLTKTRDDLVNKQKGYQDTIKQTTDLLNATDIPTRQALKDLTGIDPTSANGVQDILLAMQGLQTEADALTPQIAQVNLEMHSQGVAANDLAAAADADTQAILKEGDFKRQLASESVQQLQQQLTDTKAAQSALGNEINNNPLLSGDLRTKLGGEFFQLGTQIKDIESALSNATLQQTVQGVLALNDAYAKIQQTTERTSQDRDIQATNSLFDHIEAGIRSAQDQAIQFAQQQQDFARQSARAQDDFDRNRALEQRDFNQQTEQAAEDHEARMSQITLDARQSILEDAQRLDARAVFNDEQRRDRQLADETTSYNQQTEQRAAAFAQQLQDQQDQYNLQRERSQEDFNLQNSRQAAQYALQQSRQQEDWNTQNQRQQAQYALQDQRQAQDNATQLAALSEHYNLMDFTQNYWLTRLQQGWSAFFQGLPLPPQIQPISGQYTSGASQYGASLAGRGAEVHLHGDIVIGDIGKYSDQQVVNLVDRGLRSFFGQGMAGAGR